MPKPKKRKKKPGHDRASHREKFKQRVEASQKVAARRVRMALPLPTDDERKKGKKKKPLVLTAEEMTKELVELVNRVVDTTANLADVHNGKDRGGNLVNRINMAVRNQRSAIAELLRDLLGREPTEREIMYASTATDYISYGDLDSVSCEEESDEEDEDCDC